MGYLSKNATKQWLFFGTFFHGIQEKEELVAKGHTVGALLLIARLGLCKCLL